MAKVKRNTHQFTAKIIELLTSDFGNVGNLIYENSPLLQYINEKTKSANEGSKSRASFANHYALYVLLEDYINKGFYNNSSNYSEYEGAIFSELFKRQRELPFGAKLQNHAFNSRLNGEFKGFFPTLDIEPIIRNQETNRYWIQEDLIIISINNVNHNIAKTILKIIDAYVETKMAAFESFLNSCKELSRLGEEDKNGIISFIMNNLQPNVDARIFEIISFSILKAKYSSDTIWIGKEKESVKEEILRLFKTGRTNANDGGIDFVMKPLGKFFQVTETIDVNKYFLDIDKVQKFPISFVIKTTESHDNIKESIWNQAMDKYKVQSIVKQYMDAIEEVITINDLLIYLNEIIQNDMTNNVMNEIIIQSKVEFNYNQDLE